MIREIKISNYKTLLSAQIPLGNFTVFIGENGAGKSNIFEAIVLASAACSGKIDRELLIGRGVRVSSPSLMRSAFSRATAKKPIHLSISCDSDDETFQSFDFTLTHDGEEYSDWKLEHPKGESSATYNQVRLRKNIESIPADQREAELKALREEIKILEKAFKEISAAHSSSSSADSPLKNTNFEHTIKSTILAKAFFNFAETNALERFTVYSPDYQTLRNFVGEGQTAPLGTRGEGLLKLLATMQEKEPDRLAEINKSLNILGWYKGIDFSSLSSSSKENRIFVKDRFIRSRGVFLDQTSTNEGFLFCLFYLTLFASSATPRAFAIENIENGLNPKLSEILTKKLKEFAKQFGKQALISTHSPSVLDALDLEGGDRLLAVDRNLDGHTRVIKIEKPKNLTKKITRLSEAFLMGHLGGLPKSFL